MYCMYIYIIKLFNVVNEVVTYVNTYVFTYVNLYQFVNTCVIYTDSLQVTYTQSMFTRSTGVSSLHLYLYQSQRGCLWSPHINPMATVNHICGSSG